MVHDDTLCTVQKHKLHGYRWPGLLSQGAFFNPIKPHWCITGPFGPLGSTNQNWLLARLLPMAVLIYPVVCVHSCHLLRTQHHCLQSNNREGPPSACPPSHHISTPPTHPCPYKQHPLYCRGCNKLF